MQDAISGHTWRGKPIEDLTREELLRAVTFLGQRVHELMSDEASEDRARGRVERLRKAK